MSLEVFGETIVIINSMEIARHLLDKRGAIYSDRPAVPAYEVFVSHPVSINLMFLESSIYLRMKYDHFITVTRYNRYWRICRKITDHSLRQSAAMAYRPMQTRKVAEFLAKLLHTPDQVLDHIKQSVPDLYPQGACSHPYANLQSHRVRCHVFYLRPAHRRLQRPICRSRRDHQYQRNGRPLTRCHTPQHVPILYAIFDAVPKILTDYDLLA